MAFSGTKSFEPDVAEYIEEAFERCGIELRTGYDLRTATRSLNLMLAEWANRGLNQWTIKQNAIPMLTGTITYNLDPTDSTAAIDVLDVFVREEFQGTNTDIPLSRMSRAEYSHLATKTTTGKPNQFFVDKQLSPTVTVWPQPDKNNTYTLYVNVLTRMDDAGGGANSLQMPFRFYPCLTAGLSYYLALKKAPEKVQMLKQLYEEEFTRALSQDEERASFRIAPDLRSYNIA
jgi:hypothetical protein